MADQVLLVEDDQTIRTLMRILLEDHGYRVREAADGEQALAQFGAGGVDLVLLDVRLPGMSGFDVCREVRRLSDVPIIMVSAQQDTHDIVVGLEMGADDYVTKPFNEHELLARMRAQLRSTTPATQSYEIGDIAVKPVEGTVSKRGEELQLTKTEFTLLCYLAQHLGQVLSRPQLLEAVWDYPPDGDTRLVDTHIARLRAKIEDVPSEPELLITVRGLGYRLVRPL